MRYLSLTFFIWSLFNLKCFGFTDNWDEWRSPCLTYVISFKFIFCRVSEKFSKFINRQLYMIKALWLSENCNGWNSVVTKILHLLNVILKTLHSHCTPFHAFMIFLNAITFSADFMWCGKSFIKDQTLATYKQTNTCCYYNSFGCTSNCCTFDTQYFSYFNSFLF